MTNTPHGENYEVIQKEGLVPIKAWIKGVMLEDEARKQLLNLASLPFIHSHIAVMPDAHMGRGSTIGSVIPTRGAIIPAAVGVDLGCGMIARRTTLTAADLPDDLKGLRQAIERAVPVGFGKWADADLNHGHPVYKPLTAGWKRLQDGWYQILEKHPDVDNGKVNHYVHLGTLGTGNHFIEICVDNDEQVWLMLHSGSRGVGNRIGTYFIELARQEMKRHMIHLPDQDLAYLKEGSEYFDDYLHAVQWAQDYAMLNRLIMIDQVELALKATNKLPDFQTDVECINCHHNYVAKEYHFDAPVWVTRKGAVRAQEGDLGIIPGSMGTGSFIVRGRGNADAFNSCSHGAGRAMSRTAAKKRISLEQHLRDTQSVECRKDAGIIDESPAAYKPLAAVMKAQADLVEIVHRLRTLVCVKG